MMMMIVLVDGTSGRMAKGFIIPLLTGVKIRLFADFPRSAWCALFTFWGAAVMAAMGAMVAPGNYRHLPSAGGRTAVPASRS